MGIHEVLVMSGCDNGGNRGKCVHGRWRTAFIDYVRRWTEGGLPAARRIALDRLSQMKTENKDKKRCSEMSTALVQGL